MHTKPKTPGKRVEIYDTTLRDGSQALGVSLSLQDKLLVADALDGLGVDWIEGGYPLSNPKDAAFFQQAARKPFKRAQLVAFGMTRRKASDAAADEGLRALLDSSCRHLAIVGKSWDLHVREVLAVPNDENLRMIADSVEFLTKAGRVVFYDAEHFFDGWRANPDYALATLRAARDAGAARLVLCDTNGGSTMKEIARCVQAAAAALPDAALAIHCHNDCDLAVANTLVAVENGCSQVQGTVNGIGERCGNTDLVAVIPNLAVKHDYDLLAPGTLKNLTEVSRFVYEIANLNFRDNQPFVGASAFAHKGGMHVHAVQKNVRTYEHMDPAVVGNGRRILVSELAGTSNIAAATPKKFGIADDKAAQRKILKSLMELENQGYQFEAAEASFELLIRRALGERWYRRLWELDHYRCMVLCRDGETVSTEATVKIKVGDRMAHTVAEGDGPVNSLHRALCAALRPDFPRVDDLHLADYKVRVVNTAAETAAKVRVVIDWHDPTTESYFGSVGVSENIIDASWRALVEAIEYKLLNESEKTQ